MNNTSAVWITWEYQTRNKSLSDLLGIPLFEIVSERKGGMRYAESLVKTYRLIRSINPDVVFCQNPSIVLSFFSVFLKALFSCKVIVDEHNAGLFPLEGRSRFLNAIARYIVRKADAVIVTNASLARHCEDWGGTPIILEDPLPDFTDQLRQRPEATFCAEKKKLSPLELLFISTWAPDEPYLNVIDAAKTFSESDLRITITGNYKGKVDPSTMPSSVRLAGFLSKRDYVAALAEADGVLVLTKREDCLNCGAYEAVSLLKPGILSDTSALRGYFNEGFVFTDNSVESLVQCIKAVMIEHESLKAGITSLRSRCETHDVANRQKVMNLLATLT